MPPPDAVNEQFDLAATWLGRGITIVLIMIGPGLLGMYLDKRWQSEWMTPAGFVLGMVLGLGFLLLLVQVFPPPEGDPSKYLKIDESEHEPESDSQSDSDHVG